jgi:tripartite-type tricarboxylate transporter receptor subunit TctC
MRRWSTVLFLTIAAAAAAAGAALAQPAADFYRGKTVTLIVGYSVGGGYDTYARIVARHMARHIPGNPSIIVQNMPGAGSLRATNYLYAVAPKDGTVFGLFGRGLPMEPLIGTSATQYDSRKFSWLGSATNEVSVCAVWHTSPVKSWGDMLSKPFTVGGEGSGSDPDILSAMLKNAFGAKLKTVSGYPGSNEVALAMERGEVDGRCGWSWSSMKATRADWISGKKVNVVVQLSLSKSPELPDVPIVTEFAKTERQRQILNLILSRQVMGRPFAAPPGLPEDRKQALRAAFDATMADPEFRADIASRGLEVNPVNGTEVDKLMAQLYDTPAEAIAEAKAAIAH